MGDIVDLNALAPKAVTIKLGEDEIQLKQPKVEDVFILGSLGDKLVKSSELTEAEVGEAYNALVNKIKQMIPELANKEIGIAQLRKLVEIISEMALPPDAKDLKERGITGAIDDPKVQ